MENEPIIGFQVAASEAVKAYNDQLESIKSIKDTAKTILSSTSIVFALMSSFQITQVPLNEKSDAFFVVGSITLLLFALLIWSCIRVLLPKKIIYPLKSDWETYDTAFMGKDEVDVQKMVTNAYLETVTLNDGVIRSMVRKTEFAGYTMIAVIVGLITAFLL